MVASRWPWRLDFLAAAIKRSISAVVRYSRVRTEEFKWLVPSGSSVNRSSQYPAAPLGFCDHGHRFSPWRATRVRRHLLRFRPGASRTEPRNQQVAIRDTML